MRRKARRSCGKNSPTWAGNVRQILAALDGVDDLYFDVVSQIRLDRWSRGRVALIGDAAACVSLLAGEGTGLAMTEAYVLAGELLRANGDHRLGFANYETRLHRFVEGKQAKRGQVHSGLRHADPAGHLAAQPWDAGDEPAPTR